MPRCKPTENTLRRVSCRVRVHLNGPWGAEEGRAGRQIYWCGVSVPAEPDRVRITAVCDHRNCTVRVLLALYLSSLGGSSYLWHTDWYDWWMCVSGGWAYKQEGPQPRRLTFKGVVKVWAFFFFFHFRMSLMVLHVTTTCHGGCTRKGNSSGIR